MAKERSRPIRIAVIGSGVRGMALSRQVAACANMDARIVAVAEPDANRRSCFAEEFSLPVSRVFASWEDLFDRDDICDAVIIATMDNQHTDPALKSIGQGWHVLLEKPMADSHADCLAIEKAQWETGVVLSVCHTLRYVETYRTIQRMVSEGALGRLIHIEHMEAIGNPRFAHNYVRGRWSNENRNTFLLLHKCCHDIDLINWIMGEKCLRVSSFGNLSHFNIHQAPKGSGERCVVDCRISEKCLYSARRLYVEGDLTVWPARDVSDIHTKEAHLDAVRNGPYGVCVWRSDNDVVDHQTVLMEFEGGATGTCTLTGYSAANGRRTRLQGTEGELLYDENAHHLTMKRFADEHARHINCPAPDSYHPEDKEIVENWLYTISNPGDSRILVDAQEAQRTHEVVFAAERARREKRVVELPMMVEPIPPQQGCEQPPGSE